jgi:hypothetical protein
LSKAFVRFDLLASLVASPAPALCVGEVLSHKISKCLFSFCSVRNLKVNSVTIYLTALATAKADDFGSLLFIEKERFQVNTMNSILSQTGYPRSNHQRDEER